MNNEELNEIIKELLKPPFVKSRKKTDGVDVCIKRSHKHRGNRNEPIRLLHIARDNFHWLFWKDDGAKIYNQIIDWIVSALNEKYIRDFGIKETSRESIPEGIINIETPAAEALGFSSDAFDPHSYLWRKGNTIIISLMISKKKGEFCKLMKRISELGFDFQIPTPSARMRQIGIQQGWFFYEIESEQFGGIDILTNIEGKS